MEQGSVQFEPSIFELIISFLKKHGKKIMNVITVLGAISITLYVQWDPYPTTTKKFNRDRNGLWAGNRWLTGNEVCPSNEDCIPVSENDRKKLFRDLEQYRIRYLYVYVGPFLSDGKILDKPGSFFEKLRSELPDTVRCIAWVNSFSLEEDIEKKVWKSGVVQSITELRKYGFDGVHLNFEELPADKIGYLNLLKKVRSSFQSDFMISHAITVPVIDSLSHEIMSRALEPETWFGAAMQYADQTILLAVGTMLPFEKFYCAYVREGTRMMLQHAKKNPGHRIQIGLPAAEYGQFRHSFAPVENLTNGIKGVMSALENYTTLPLAFEGISLYTYYTSGSFDWRIMDSLWVGK